MDEKDALYALMASDGFDFERAYFDKFGMDEDAFRNLLHLQGEINALVAAVERNREGY
jgi:hypothetical protein